MINKCQCLIITCIFLQGTTKFALDCITVAMTEEPAPYKVLFLYLFILLGFCLFMYVCKHVCVCVPTYVIVYVFVCLYLLSHS